MAKQPPETFQDFHFPKAGIDRAGPFGRQPVRPGKREGEYFRTTHLGHNVRAFDPVSMRDRGGSRPGLTKFIVGEVNGVFWIVQHLNSLVTTTPGALTVQQSQSGRVVFVLAVSQGKVKVATPDAVAWAGTTNNTGEEPELNFSGVMQSAQNNQKMYFVDGVNYCYFAPKTNSMEKWAATAGTLPKDEDGNKARLICTWRGRTVLSGLLKDPQNWFMSKVSDPTNFDYFPAAASATDAVAGNNAGLGLIGDIVTALIPYNDDILVFGGDHTIYMMRGDPLAGGQIDLVSDSIGIAFGEAWCKDPYGNIYFFSNKCGLYKFVPGQMQPIRISQAIEVLAQEIDTGRNIIRMVWNDRFQGVHVFVTWAELPQATTHFFWEMRTNAWWTDGFGNPNHNPLAAAVLDGNDPNDRRLLIGGWDGIVRMLDPTAVDDDGTPISSAVVIGPILTQEQDEMLLKDVQAVLAVNSNPVTFETFVGDTAEQALASVSTVTGTWAAARNNTSPIRRSGHAIYLKLSCAAVWAMETIRARFAGRGKVRRRN